MLDLPLLQQRADVKQVQSRLDVVALKQLGSVFFKFNCIGFGRFLRRVSEDAVDVVVVDVVHGEDVGVVDAVFEVAVFVVDRDVLARDAQQ